MAVDYRSLSLIGLIGGVVVLATQAAAATLSGDELFQSLISSESYAQLADKSSKGSRQHQHKESSKKKHGSSKSKHRDCKPGSSSKEQSKGSGKKHGSKKGHRPGCDSDDGNSDSASGDTSNQTIYMREMY